MCSPADRSPARAQDLPLSPSLSRDCPRSPRRPLSPGLCDTTRTLGGLSLSRDKPAPSTPLRALANPPSKRKLLSRGHGAGGQGGYFFSGPQRWLRGHNDSLGGPLSEGVYTRQRDQDLPFTLAQPGDFPSSQPLSPLPSPLLSLSSQASSVLASRRGRQREARPHVRRIFVEPCKEASPPGTEGRRWAEEELEGGEGVGVSVVVVTEPGQGQDGGSVQDVDSDDQSDAQVSEILSSTL